MAALVGRMMPLLNKLVPAGLALKGISRISPRLANFATDSLSAGYGADQILDYLRDRVGSEGDIAESKRLQGAGLTPTEKRAAGKRKQQESGKTIASTAIGLAAGIGGMPGKEAGAQAIKGQILPAIKNQMQSNPVTLNGNMRIGNAQQQKQIGAQSLLGIPKISGQQIPRAPQGSAPNAKDYDQENMVAHIEQQMSQRGQPQSNIIQQVSPQLHKFIQSEIQSGRPPAVAAFRALENSKFKKIIDRIETKTETNIEDLIQSIYGAGQQAAQEGQQSQQMQQGQQQSQQGQAALMQTIQQLKQLRGG